MPGHIHAFAAAAEVPGMRHLCGLCGHIAAQPQVCTEPECGFVACLACITPEPAALPMEGSMSDGADIDLACKDCNGARTHAAWIPQRARWFELPTRPTGDAAASEPGETQG